MSYRTPLAYRRRKCEVRRNRYASDPEFRLAMLNENRARHGRPLLTLDDMVPLGEGRSKAPRDAKGRFVQQQGAARGQ